MFINRDNSCILNLSTKPGLSPSPQCLQAGKSVCRLYGSEATRVNVAGFESPAKESPLKLSHQDAASARYYII